MSLLNKFLFTFVIIISTVSLADECEYLLSTTIKKTQAYDLNSISPFYDTHRGSIDHKMAKDGAVVSFGSGGDILNLLTTFIEAKEFHLVDVLAAWGAGPGEVVFEVMRRLKHVSKDHQVKVISQGFTQFVDQKKLMTPPFEKEEWHGDDSEARDHFDFGQTYWSKWGYPTRDEFDPRYLQPLVLEFVLEEDSQNRIRRVYLHPLDFDSDDHVDRLRRRIELPLKGLFVSGVSHPQEMELFINDLDKGGYFVFEMYKQFEPILDLLENYGSTQLFPVHKKDYKDEEVRYIHFQKK